MSKDKLVDIEFIGTTEQEEKLRKEIEKLREAYHYNDLAVPALKKARDIYGCLPASVQMIIADALDIKLEEVEKASRFYPERRESSRGKYNISVCMGTACYIRGAGEILEELKLQLEINPESGAATKDGLFSLDACRCVGACGLAPLILVNDDVYGRIKPEDISKILEKYKKLGKKEVLY